MFLSSQVILNTEGRQLKARIELLNAPNNPKQTYEIFTNNGDLANRLMHPRFELDREYAVRVHGQVPEDAVGNMLKGAQLEDGLARFKKIEYRGGEGVNTWYHVVINEGRNREVRRLWQSQGVEVSRLIRVRYGALKLPRNLSRGQHVELSPKEVEAFVSRL